MINISCIGTLGKDATVNNAGSTKVINFSVAVTIGYGDNKKTQWLECAKFGEKTGVSEFLKKGTKVYVSGEPSLRTYDNNGEKVTNLNVKVQEIELLSNPNQPEVTF